MCFKPVTSYSEAEAHAAEELLANCCNIKQEDSGSPVWLQHVKARLSNQAAGKQTCGHAMLMLADTGPLRAGALPVGLRCNYICAIMHFKYLQ